MTQRTLIRNVRLLDPASRMDAVGALLIEDGRIADHGPDLNAADAKIIDGDGLCLAPGLVDMRVRVGKLGGEHKETVLTASQAAAAGGITSMACLPDSEEPLDDLTRVEFLKRRAQDTGLVRLYPQAAVTRGLEGNQLTEMGLLAEAGVVAFTDGGKAIANAGIMRRALNYAKMFGKPIIQHPEEPSLASNGQMNAGEIATRHGLTGISPMAEVIMIERDLRLVEITGGRLHIAHVSTAESVEVIRRAKRRGLPVTCGTAPPYFALTEVDTVPYNTLAKLSPPLRDEADRRAIVEGFADGTIDAIASDHTPQDMDSKRVPFAQASFGAVGLETLLPLVLELVHKGQLHLLDALAKVTIHPARILGLPHGRLERGQPADLMLFDPDAPYRIDASTFRSKSRNTPFDRRPVQGRVLRTFVNGRTVFNSTAEVA